jgi:hypothetical protein
MFGKMRALSSALAFSVMLLLAACPAARGQGLTLYVAPNGDDAWSGKLAEPKGNDGPLATLRRARDKIRRLKSKGALPAGGVVVEVRGGTYQFTAPLALTADDSGAAGAPIVYRARPDEEVRLVGGVEIPNFQPVVDPVVLKRLDASARGKVVQADVRALGVKDLGQVAGDNRFELFYQDKPMTLARWPNNRFVHIVDLVGGKPCNIRGDVGDAIGRFTYDGNRPTRWAGEKDIWLHGYWWCDNADQYHKVDWIDTAKRTIAVLPPYHGYGYRKGQWYYALNLLCELDRPGEWYLDRTSGILYFWPPASAPSFFASSEPSAHAKALVSVIPTLVSMKNTTHVTLRGMILEASRGTAITADDADDVHVVGCTIRNTGSWAVMLTGKNSSVVGCDIYETSCGGISLTGGDRKTLTPANLVADNNHIHHYSRWIRICQPGIALTGVGNRATHNLIDNCPHQAIAFSGNDNLIEMNEIHSACYESGDAGTIYAGRNWTWRGNVIRYNYLHDINGFEGHGCVGVYFDDQLSGNEVFGNLFYNVSRAAMIGGGRDCIIANNIFVDCVPATHVDARGLGWAGADGGATMKHTLIEVPYKNALWASRYPKLPPILEEDPMAPKGNLIARNICVGGRWGDFEAKAKPMVTFKHNFIDVDPGFVDRAHKNFQLRDDSPVYKQGFQRIPMEKFGLYESPDRCSWPVESLVRPNP